MPKCTSSYVKRCEDSDSAIKFDKVEQHQAEISKKYGHLLVQIAKSHIRSRNAELTLFFSASSWCKTPETYFRLSFPPGYFRDVGEDTVFSNYCNMAIDWSLVINQSDLGSLWATLSTTPIWACCKQCEFSVSAYAYLSLRTRLKGPGPGNYFEWNHHKRTPRVKPDPTT